MNKIMERVLKESKKGKKIVGIRKYEAGDEFWCGYIIDYNNENVLIQHYTKYGKPDGVIVERIENIESIDSDDHYSKTYQYLVKNSHKIEKQTPTIIELGNADNWFKAAKKLRSKNELITIEMNDDTLARGLVHEVDAEFINLKCIDELGETIGNALYRISDITSLSYGRKEERKRKLLYDWRNGVSKSRKAAVK